jgi:hypothetical protein
VKTYLLTFAFEFVFAGVFTNTALEFEAALVFAEFALDTEFVLAAFAAGFFTGAASSCFPPQNQAPKTIRIITIISGANHFMFL